MCIKPVVIKNPKESASTREITVPCGRCHACKVNRADLWKMRIQHELHYFNDKGIFTTLTYNDENCPKSLQKDDLQKFFKRLRKRLKGRPIKYYACGEYGGQTARPHYHAIIMGLDYLNKDDHMIIDSSWQLGYIKNGYCSGASIGYVTKYIQKKTLGPKGQEVYQDKEPPFQVCSQGIGLRWLKDNEEFINKNGYVQFEGGKKPLPRYYRDKANLDEDLILQQKFEAAERLRNYDQEGKFSKDIERFYPGLKKFKNESEQIEHNLAYKIAKKEDLI